MILNGSRNKLKSLILDQMGKNGNKNKAASITVVVQKHRQKKKNIATLFPGH